MCGMSTTEITLDSATEEANENSIPPSTSTIAWPQVTIARMAAMRAMLKRLPVVANRSTVMAKRAKNRTAIQNENGTLSRTRPNPEGRGGADTELMAKVFLSNAP
jgi:hypothetical protein